MLDETICGIKILEHRHARGSRAESIIDDIVAQQKPEVDSIAVATGSSIVLKKAVDNALSRFE